MKLWWIERMAKHDFSFHILCSLDFFSSFLFSVLYLFQSPHMLNALFCAVEKKNQQQRQRQRQHSSELLLSIVSSNIWCTSIKNTNFILKKHFDIETKAVIHIIYSIVWQYRVCLCSLQLNRRAEDWQCIKGKRRRVNSKKTYTSCKGEKQQQQQQQHIEPKFQCSSICVSLCGTCICVQICMWCCVVRAHARVQALLAPPTLVKSVSLSLGRHLDFILNVTAIICWRVGSK